MTILDWILSTLQLGSGYSMSFSSLEFSQSLSTVSPISTSEMRSRSSVVPCGVVVVGGTLAILTGTTLMIAIITAKIC